MSTVTDSDIADVLERSLALMNNSGAHWGKGAYVDGEGVDTKYCSVGAIRTVSGVYGFADGRRRDLHHVWESNSGAIAALGQTLEERGFAYERGTEKSWVIDWNDAHARTWEDVVDVFTTTIKRLRGTPS